MNKASVEIPSLQEQHEIIRHHIDDILIHYGESIGVKIARKHIGWYSKGLTNSTDFRVAINQVEDGLAVHALIDKFYLPFYT